MTPDFDFHQDFNEIINHLSTETKSRSDKERQYITVSSKGKLGTTQDPAKAASVEQVAAVVSSCAKAIHESDFVDAFFQLKTLNQRFIDFADTSSQPQIVKDTCQQIDHYLSAYNLGQPNKKALAHAKDARTLAEQVDVFGWEHIQRLAKAFTSIPFSTLLNRVTKLQKGVYSVPIEGVGTVVFKEAVKSAQHTNTLEQLHWEIANFFGIEDQFTPTMTVSRNASEKASDMMHVSIQPYHQEGKTLDRQIREKGIEQVSKMIEKNTLIDASLTSLLVSGFDLHKQNIFITNDGKIKFFDNARSLPHSNGAILWGGGSHLLSSYRSALLQLSGSSQPLSHNDLERISNQVKAYQSRLDEFSQFLSESSTCSQLPVEWFDTALVVKAMGERLDNMLKALEDRKISNLQDLVFAAIPGYKFTVALHQICFQRQGLSSDIEELASDVGYYPLEDLVNSAAPFCNIEYLHHECMTNPDKSISEIISEARGLAPTTDGAAVVTTLLAQDAYSDNKDVTSVNPYAVFEKRFEDWNARRGWGANPGQI